MHAHKIPVALPCEVTLTRLSPRKLDDDNLVGAFKWIRDAISEHFLPGLRPGRADDNPGFTWKYAQTRAKDYGIHLQFHWSEDDPVSPQ